MKNHWRVNLHNGIQVLKELSDYTECEDAHSRRKDNQKLLRNLMILEMVIQGILKNARCVRSGSYNND